MSDTVQSAGDNTVNKTKFLPSGSLYSSKRQNIMNKNMDVRTHGVYSKKAIQFGTWHGSSTNYMSCAWNGKLS